MTEAVFLRIPPYSSVFLRMQRLRNIIRSSPLAPVARRIYRRITLLLIRVLLSRRRVPVPADDNRDTFVFGNDHLGDVVVRLPFLDALSRRARGRSGRMVVVVAPAYADFLRRTGVADHVIALSREETLSLYQWRRVRRLLHRELAPYRFREAVNSIHMGHLPQDDLLMTAISAQESFGSFDPVFQNYAVLDSSHLPYGHFYRYDRGAGGVPPLADGKICGGMQLAAGTGSPCACCHPGQQGRGAIGIGGHRGDWRQVADGGFDGTHQHIAIGRDIAALPAGGQQRDRHRAFCHDAWRSGGQHPWWRTLWGL